jgi:hypothetical protein
MGTRERLSLINRRGGRGQPAGVGVDQVMVYCRLCGRRTLRLANERGEPLVPDDELVADQLAFVPILYRRSGLPRRPDQSVIYQTAV